MADIRTVITCKKCGRSGNVGWGAAAERDAATFQVSSLSAGFLLIEASDGAVRIECATCRTPVEGLKKLLGGWEQDGLAHLPGPDEASALEKPDP